MLRRKDFVIAPKKKNGRKMLVIKGEKYPALYIFIYKKLKIKIKNNTIAQNLFFL